MSHYLLIGLLTLCGLSTACSSKNEAPQVAQPMAADTTTANQALKIAFKSDPNPPHEGNNVVEVSVQQADGTPVKDATVTAVFYMPAMPSMNMPEMRSKFTLAPEGDGVYKGSGQLVMNGTWDVTVKVARDDGTVDSKKFTVIAK